MFNPSPPPHTYWFQTTSLFVFLEVILISDISFPFEVIFILRLSSFVEVLLSFEIVVKTTVQLNTTSNTAGVYINMTLHYHHPDRNSTPDLKSVSQPNLKQLSYIILAYMSQLS